MKYPFIFITSPLAEHWTELAERAFDFATHAREAFISGGMQTKKEILMALGQNPTMKDGKFSLKANLWLVPISENYPALEKEYRALEPTQFTDITTQNTAKQALCSIWLPIVLEVRTIIQNSPDYIFIPKLRQAAWFSVTPPHPINDGGYFHRIKSLNDHKEDVS